MIATAELEIAALRQIEHRQVVQSAEADRLVYRLLSHYACDFVVSEIPPGGWVKLPRDWAMGVSEPVPFHYGFPPKTERGAVGVSLDTLRSLARALP